MCRFSDEKLQEFYEDFQKHVKEGDSYREANDVILQKLVDAQEEHTRMVKELSESTKGVVGVYEDIAAGGRLASKIGSFAKWLASLAIFVAIYHYFNGGK